MVEKVDFVYMSAPILLVLSAISWYGAHNVSIVVIGVMVVMIPALFYIVYAEKFDEYWIRREETQPAQLYIEDTMVIIIAKIRLYANAKRDMRPLLRSLRERIKHRQYDLVEAVNLGLIRVLLTAYSDNLDFETNISTSIDVINELLLVTRAKRAFQGKSEDLKFCTSVVSKIVSTCTSRRKSVEDVGLNDADDEKIVYKCIITLGMMCEECTETQYAVADADGIETVLDAMDMFPESKLIAKWSNWSLINVTMNHPPNRCDFVNAAGIPRVLKVLKYHDKDPGIQMQAMGLFLNIFVEDPGAKYSIPRARESALTNGLGVILQDNLDNFSKDTKLCAVCRKLQNALMKVWT